MDIKKVQSILESHQPKILGSESFSRFAIFLPLIQKENEIHVLFEVRSHQLRRQPGDICFPGGRMDPDDKIEKFTAIRETMEELGLNREDISDVFPLDYLVSPFGMMVFPYAGFIKQEKFRLNKAEVEEVFTVPLSFFIKNTPRIYRVNFRVEPEEGFPYELLVGGKDYNWRARQMEEYFYLYDNRVIWGLTARILFHFIEIIKNK
ncbi:NUDIX hydrolase [Neobacillus sp. D3-1R]|uniref:NUDIX hydrolase n=1 Tax=Neobacillus sp. D3-1R TaxID=3445778 RepID=UPI003FA11C34